MEKLYTYINQIVRLIDYLFLHQYSLFEVSTVHVVLHPIIVLLRKANLENLYYFDHVLVAITLQFFSK